MDRCTSLEDGSEYSDAGEFDPPCGRRPAGARRWQTAAQPLRVLAQGPSVPGRVVLGGRGQSPAREMCAGLRRLTLVPVRPPAPQTGMHQPTASYLDVTDATIGQATTEEGGWVAAAGCCGAQRGECGAARRGRAGGRELARGSLAG